MKKNVFKKLLLVPLFMAMSKASFANPTSAEVFNNKAIQVYVFKNSADKPNIVGFEFMLIVAEGAANKIWKVSTGKEGAVVGGDDGTIATPNGYFEFEDFNFNNGTTPNFRPDNAVVFFSKDMPNGVHVEIAVHDSAPVTGSPASHGCVRTNGAAYLKNILREYGDATSGAILITDGDKSRDILAAYGIETEEDIRDLAP